MWSWLTSFIGKSSSTGGGAVSNGASLPPLPTGSVSAVADTLTEVGRIVEQQTNLRNTPQMQQAAQAVQQEQRKEQIENDIETQNTDSTRIDLAG